MIKVRPPEDFKSGEPGFYRDVPEAEYHALDACSNSRLTNMLKSAAHCEAAIHGGYTDSPDKKFGRAMHSRLLQPDVFWDNYSVYDGDRRTKAGKESYAVAVEKVGEESAIPLKSNLTFSAMISALERHPPSWKVLSLGGLSELSALWIHEPTGLLCKMRIDRYVPELGLLVDYKTARNSDPWHFEKSLYQWGYHRQGANYLMGMAALGEELKRFVVIAQEKEPPFCAVGYQIVQAALEAGKTQSAPLYKKYAECRESGIWPGYRDDKIIQIDIPDWAYTSIYDEELNNG